MEKKWKMENVKCQRERENGETRGIGTDSPAFWQKLKNDFDWFICKSWNYLVNI